MNKLPKIRLFLHKNQQKVYYSILGIIIIFLLTLIFFIYKDLKSQNIVKYCYALFVANAIAANCLFSLGRSNVFLDRYPEKNQQTLIYSAGIAFLASALIGLLVSGFIYFELSEVLDQFNLTKNEYYINLIHFTTAILLTFSIIGSIVGIVNFFRWFRHESEKLMG
ncbi:hypothetical protein [Flavobacterium capsici]|uniref:Uncharacterized protein n=1 Tax=Flavobacterium capsici TaxID=3075618 RepID=A0AA96J4S2_9FLAO|nr:MULTISPECIES: hypothetical protein [unclassified Flavobacterium]WNM18100.1 hypothetical protein RN608_08750 [Flavobacterium sp. PMR2A8]WNM22152.1 hypothetical protein RN605_02050 [Flavobacterium sp. PMTSA4]